MSLSNNEILNKIFLRTLFNRLSMNRSWVLYWRDQLGPPQGWSRSVWMALQSSHLNNRQVYAVTVFLLGNGISPYDIRRYYNHQFKLPAQRVKDYEHLITVYTLGRLKFSYWDVSDQRTRRVVPKS